MEDEKHLNMLIALLLIVLVVITAYIVTQPKTEAPVTPEAVPVAPPEEAMPATHTILITEKGFEPVQLTINTGDTVIWKNVRNKPSTQFYAYIIGTVGPCRTPILESPYPPGIAPGESFNFTFNQAGQCTYIDGIQKQQGKIFID